jgi:glucoamylase
VSPRVAWRFSHRLRTLPAGKNLRVEVLAPATLHWTSDDWKTVADAPTADTGLGLHVVDLPTHQLPAGRTVRFTFHWTEAARWEGEDFAVSIGDA